MEQAIARSDPEVRLKPDATYDHGSG